MSHAHKMHLNAAAPTGNSRCAACFAAPRGAVCEQLGGARGNPQLKSRPNDRTKCKTSATTCNKPNNNQQPTTNNIQQ